MRNLDATAVVCCLAMLAASIGWGLNVVKLIGMLGEPITAEVVVRGIGVLFAPLGAIAGYF